MGQQQLLLIVLGIVVVGVAILAGFAAAEISFKQHDADALINRCLHIAQDAVNWKTKTEPFEGGNASYAGLASGGFERLFVGDETEGGLFKIETATVDSLVIVAVSKRFPEVGVRVSVAGDEIVDTDVDYDGGITLN